MTSSRIHVQLPGAAPAWPSLLGAALVCALLGTFLHRFGQHGQAPAKHEAAAAALPAGLQGPLSAAIGAADPTYAAHAVGEGWRAYAQGDRLRSDFAKDGVTVSVGSTRLRLSAATIGTGAAAKPLGAVRPAWRGNRIEYAHAGSREWYVNGPLGLEQGFTIERAANPSATRTLSLSMSIDGNVHPSLSADGRAVLLARAGGPALRYGGLSVRDANGRQLPSRLSLDGARLRIHAVTSHARYPVTIDPLLEQAAQRPVPSGEGEAGRFGFAVALSADGTTALIGAPGDSGFAGAAFVFARSGSSWTQQGPKLSVNEATNAEEEQECATELNECGFGRSVALSADGNTALIGAPRANGAQGAAWAFTRSGATWSQFGGKLTGMGEAVGEGSFGRSVALSGDGQSALVGAPRDAGGRGAAWAFARSAAGFVPQGPRLTGAGEAGGAYFGRSVALSFDGTSALIGGPGDASYLGAVWGFARSSGEWTLQGEKLTGGGEEAGEGRFGFSVAISADGGTALVGGRSDAAGRGAAWPLARAGSSWTHQGPKLTAAGELGEGQFGYAVALSADGTTALIGAPHEQSLIGASWTFTRAGTSWTQQAEQHPAAGEAPEKVAFGTGLALSGDAGTALIGAPHEARRLGGVWSYLTSPTPVEPGQPQPDEGGSPVGQTPGTGNQASTPSARSGVLASSTAALPAPTLGVTGNVIRLSGIVRVKLPGSRVFTLLTGEQIPFGSIVDARRGRVSVTTAAAHGGTQTMIFYQGEFRLTQRSDGLVTSALLGGSYARCRSSSRHAGRARASASRKHTVRKLWAEGHGSYSTKGSYATGAVLGTRWLTEDTCAGTLIRVLTDRVAVTDLVTHRRLTVTAGHSYLAKAPRRRTG
jgi:hypothetical protein